MHLHFSECPTATVIQRTAWKLSHLQTPAAPLVFPGEIVSGTQEVLNNIRVTDEETRHLQKVYRKINAGKMMSASHVTLLKEYKQQTKL